MAVKMQLAIQGGGAKICDLLAAAEVIEDLWNTDKIEVTRVAGTSAGSIVACILASREKTAAAFRTTLRTDGAKFLKAIVPAHVAKVLQPAQGTWRVRRWWDVGSLALRRVVWGHPLFEERQLRQLLESFFGEATTLATLNIETFVIAADVRDGRPEKYSKSGRGDEKIVRCLLDSCGIPYFFRAPRNLGSRAFVDGGVCENLPSDFLLDASDQLKRKHDLEEFGPVIGISFDDDNTPHREPEKGFLEFSMALMDTFISNSVYRAKQSIGSDAVYEIKTKIDTFDFNQALEVGLGDEHYNDVKKEAGIWFAKLISALEEKSQNLLVTLSNPWAHKTRESADVMLQVGDAYEKGFKNLKYKLTEASMIAVAYCLLPKEDLRSRYDDKQIYRLAIEPEDEDGSVSSIGVSVDDRARYPDWTLRNHGGGEKSQKVDITVVPMIRRVRPKQADETKQGESEQGAGEDWALLFFHPPVTKETAPYMVKETCEIPSMMAPLKDEGRDYLLLEAVVNTIDQANLVLILPSEFRKAHQMRPAGLEKDATRDASGRLMTAEELDQCLRNIEIPKGFEAVGWTGRPLGSGKRIAVEFVCDVPPQRRLIGETHP
jgi:predicted acylesterase/phospholipase RssA